MQKTVYHAYTTKYDGLSNKLKNEIRIKSGEKVIKGIAQWDTGANRTCISKKVIESLGLVSIGKMNISTPNKVSVADIYMVDILFPNDVKVVNVPVCGTNIDVQGIEVLIGMDIITLGDLSVSNYNSNTVFSFRVPSRQHIDFVREIKIENAIGPKHGKGKRKKRKKRQ